MSLHAIQEDAAEVGRSRQQEIHCWPYANLWAAVFSAEGEEDLSLINYYLGEN